MTCPQCEHGCALCRDNTLLYIQERTGIQADDTLSAVRQMAARINALQTALGAMEEQRNLFRQAYYQNRVSRVLAED